MARWAIGAVSRHAMGFIVLRIERESRGHLASEGLELTDDEDAVDCHGGINGGLGAEPPAAAILRRFLRSVRLRGLPCWSRLSNTVRSSRASPAHDRTRPSRAESWRWRRRHRIQRMPTSGGLEFHGGHRISNPESNLPRQRSSKLDVIPFRRCSRGDLRLSLKRLEACSGASSTRLEALMEWCNG